jgi:hypothetical protein
MNTRRKIIQKHEECDADTPRAVAACAAHGIETSAIA